MDSITTVNVHRFRDDLVVEIVGTSAGGEVTVHSYEFDKLDGNRVQAHAPVPTTTAEIVADELANSGYQLVQSAKTLADTGVAD